MQQRSQLNDEHVGIFLIADMNRILPYPLDVKPIVSRAFAGESGFNEICGLRYDIRIVQMVNIVYAKGKRSSRDGSLEKQKSEFFIRPSFQIAFCLNHHANSILWNSIFLLAFIFSLS